VRPRHGGIELFDAAHQFSERVKLFIETPGVQISTCPLVENGFIRVMCSPSYSRRAAQPVSAGQTA
jgi:hypothetical protein